MSWGSFGPFAPFGSSSSLLQGSTITTCPAATFGVWMSRRLELVLPRDASVVCLSSVYDLAKARSIEKTLRGLGWEVMLGRRHGWMSGLGLGLWFVGGTFLAMMCGAMPRVLGMSVAGVGAGACFFVGWRFGCTNPGGLITAYRPWHLEAEAQCEIEPELPFYRSCLAAHIFRFRHIASGRRFVLANAETTGDAHYNYVAEFAAMHVGTVGTLSGLTEFTKLPMLIAASTRLAHACPPLLSLDEQSLPIFATTPTETGTLAKVKIVV